jgi:hypothetical protein
MNPSNVKQLFTRLLAKTGMSVKQCAVVILALSVVFQACKKDRAAAKPALGYTSGSAFYNKYQQQEQVFQVDSPGTGPIIGKMGTKLYPYANIFMFPNGANVTYPFTVKLIEIYPVKDIILSNMPTVAGGKIMESKAEIRARAFKGTTELVLRPGRKFGMETATVSNMLTGMSVFYGFPNGSITDWTNNVTTLDPTITPDTLSSVANLTSSYAMTIARMGWTACARLLSYTGGTSAITITATGNNPQNIDVFLVFKNNPTSVMKAYNLQSGQIPLGTQVTMVAIAYDQTGALVYDMQSLTVTSGMTVTLNPVATTESALLGVLSGL